MLRTTVLVGDSTITNWILTHSHALKATAFTTIMCEMTVGTESLSLSHYHMALDH